MKLNSLLVGIVLSTLLVVSFTQQNCCGQNVIRVRGDGQAKVTPNLAIIYVSLSQTGKTSSQALSKIDTQLDSIYNILQANGISKNDITTSSISIYPQYNYTNGTSVIIGSTVYIYLTITIRGINNNSQKIATVIDAIASVGVNSISGITYDTSDPNAGKSTARKNAWNDALNKAKQYAALAGRKLGKVLVIDESNQIYSSPYYGALGLNQGGPSSMSTPPAGLSATPQIPIGQVVARVSNVITWQLV